MAGVSKISFYPVSTRSYFGEQPLTAATRAKLIALGVNTAGIRTEAEGLRRLHRAEAEQAEKVRENSKAQKSKNKNTVDENLQKARQLAKELNITYSDYENVTQIVTKIKEKLAEMKTEAKDDFDKNSYIDSYQKRLDEIVLSDQNPTPLSTTLDATANVNIALHGLY